MEPRIQPRNRIVVVDSSSSALMVLTRALELQGHEVHTAATGGAGLALVERVEPDIVISAIELAELNGFELAHAIRHNLEQQPLLIAHSGHGKASIRDSAIAAGFDLYLAKPTLFEELFRAIAVRCGREPSEELRW